MFHSVYHDYHLTYGTVSTFTPPAGGRKFCFDAFRFREALCLVGGNQLMISGFFTGDQNLARAQEPLQYMETLVHAHVAGRKWLNLGVWKPPVDVGADLIDLDVTESMITQAPPRKGVPAVLSGCFELDGELCVVLVNHTAQPRTAHLKLDPTRYGLAGQRFQLDQLYPQAIKNLCASSILAHDLDMPAQSVWLLLVRPGA